MNTQHIRIANVFSLMLKYLSAPERNENTNHLLNSLCQLLFEKQSTNQNASQSTLNIQRKINFNLVFQLIFSSEFFHRISIYKFSVWEYLCPRTREEILLSNTLKPTIEATVFD